jgi:hypothetical protein
MTTHRDISVWTFWGAVFTAALLSRLGEQWDERARWA